MTLNTSAAHAQYHVTDDLKVYYLASAGSEDVLEGFFEARKREVGAEGGDCREFVEQVREKWLIDEVEVEGGWRVEFDEEEGEGGKDA